jgi:hypothetical protein
MTQSSTIFDRIDQAAKLSRQLSGKAAARTVCDAFVAERIADIKKMQQGDMPLARYARLVAPALGVRPAALLDALRRAGFISAVRSSTKTDTRSAPSAPAPAAPTPPGTRSRISDLPTWADGSDKRADETDADYRLRKQFEGPPEAKRKFIGEHNT